MAAAVLAAGPARLHDPDARRGDVAGQAGAVAAGPLDPGQGDGPEPAQPAQQARVPARRGRELLHAEQPADRIERGSDVRGGVRVHAAGDSAAVFYDGHAIPISLDEGVARTRWPSDPVNPGLLHRTGRSGRHAGGYCKNLGPADERLEGQPRKERQPVRRSGRTQAPHPTPAPPQNHASRAGAGSTIHSLPADYLEVY